MILKKMDQNTDINFGLRLKQARLRAKLSLDGLSELLGGTISKQAINKYEKGLMSPSSTNLIALSKALSTDINYFFRPFSQGIQDLCVSFRKKSCLGKKDITALTIDIQEDIEKLLEIKAIVGGCEQNNLPAVNTDIISNSEDAEREAKNLRLHWGLGVSPIANTQELLEANGIYVLLKNGPEGFDGVSGIVNNNEYIIVANTNIRSTERQRFTIMHELAHMLFNERFDTSLTEREQERLCDAFANEMLIPSEMLRVYFNEKRPITTDELVFVQEKYGISIDAIMHKLASMGIINEARYRKYNIRKNTEEGLKDVICKSRFTEKKISRLNAMVYGALAAGLISESKAASLLGESLDDIHTNFITL